MQKKVVVIFLFKGVVEVIYDLQKYLVGLGLIEVIDKNKVDLLCMLGKKDLYLVSVFYVIVFELDIDGNFFDQDIYGCEELCSFKLFYVDYFFIFLVWDI